MVKHAVTTLDVKPPTSSRAHLELAPEVKRALTEAVAQELHKIHGGNAVLDWLEAEILVQDVLERGELQRS